jgi:hypothetical protein
MHTHENQSLMPVERMLLVELIRQRGEMIAPIQARIDAALTAIAERVGVPVSEMVVNAETGAITVRPTVVAAEPLEELS